MAETSEYIKDIIKTHPDYKELELPVGPKFKVGDWIIYNGEGTIPIQIMDIIKNSVYMCKSVEGLHGNYDIYNIEHTDRNYHLWSIADAKNGDVLSTYGIICIFKKLDKDGYYIISPCIYMVKDGLEVINDEKDSIGSCGFKPATKEDRELLFRKMKEAGYQWDADKKELNKIQPHYDIANFHAGMPVLVRCTNSECWKYGIYSHYGKYEAFSTKEYFICVGSQYMQCIPYEGNEHLLGTTDMCPEEYINW